MNYRELQSLHKKRITTEIEAYEDYLSGGKVTDMLDYKRVIGIMKGLHLSSQLLDDIVTKFKRNELTEEEMFDDDEL